MTRRLMFGLAVSGLLTGVVGEAKAGGIQAYFTSNTTGNQDFGGNLGVDFNVNSPITVTELGAFDSSALGFNPGITVALYQRLPGGNPNTDYNGALLTSVTIIGVQGSVSGNYRFLDLTSPLTLTAGYYSVVAVGFNGLNLNLNENSGGVLIQTNDGGGLVSFVGSGRFDGNSSLDYPTYTTDDQGFNTSPHVFGGGSFVYSAASAVPEPPSLTLLSIGTLGMTGCVLLRSRRQA
jgi:hypothetical protein